MLKNKCLVFVVFVLIFVSLGMVSAQDQTNITTQKDNIVDYIGDLNTTINNNHPFIKDNNVNMKTEYTFNGTGDFNELENLINKTPDNGILTLHKDYTYNGDRNFQGLEFTNNNITIDGQGHTIKHE